MGVTLALLLAEGSFKGSFNCPARDGADFTLAHCVLFSFSGQSFSTRPTYTNTQSEDLTHILRMRRNKTVMLL